MTACVLLSTYNGERFLHEQLEAVLCQSVAELRLVIRDDGSSDATKEILDSYSHDPRIEVHFGPNIGVVRSFFELLRIAPEADFYSFCDQDDWWHPEKLQRAKAKFDEVDPELPAGVVCRLAIANKSLEIEFETDRPPRGYTLRNALIENVVTGCALSVNSAARRLLMGAVPNPSEVVMHDWWIYMALTAAGEMRFDEQVGVVYRQHGDNVVGASRGLALLSARLRRFLRKDSKARIRRQAQEFLRCFEARLSKEQRTIVVDLIDMLGERSALQRGKKALLSMPTYRQRRIDTIIFMALVVLGRV